MAIATRMQLSLLLGAQHFHYANALDAIFSPRPTQLLYFAGMA
jgi:hypothetical protein